MGVGRHKSFKADMRIIETNPYRQLGVYANSPIKERVANHNKLQAFLKVGKQVDFPLDLIHYLPPIHRTSETIAQADASLTLPKEQLKYAQFWFIKATPLDDIAFNHLQAGNMDAAIDIWKKKDCVSSLQNRIVCALIKEDYGSALSCAEQFYAQYLSSFIAMILDTSNDNAYQTIAWDFIDTLCEEVGVNVILPYITDESWKEHVSETQVIPLIASIQAAIDVAKSSKGEGSSARYDAGVKLMNVTKKVLQQLKAFLTTADLQYQMIADKLGLEILQCGIDYYNDSGDDDAAYRAMELQKYAQSIVVGKMAKDMCGENVNIFQKIIDELPPTEVFSEDKIIKDELRKFSINLNSSFDIFFRFNEKINEGNIRRAKELLKVLYPPLQTIKEKISSNSYYLKMSDMVVENALNTIITEINKINNVEMYLSGKRPNNLESSLIETWNVLEYILHNFDMSSKYKQERFMPTRHSFIMLCNGYNINVLPFLYRIRVTKSLLLLIIILPFCIWIFTHVIAEL